MISFSTYTAADKDSMLFNGSDNPKNCSFLWEISTSFNTQFLGTTQISPINHILIGSAIFAGLTNVTDRHTDTHRDRGGSRSTVWRGPWRARSASLYWEFGGCAPSGVQGQSPWSGGQGGKAPLKLNAFRCCHMSEMALNCMLCL